jgi:hypothetical protein
VNISLAGQKILFIGIGFYDYEKSIQRSLEALGATVTYHLQQPRWHQFALLRTLAGTLGYTVASSLVAYQDRLLEKLAAQAFDIVFVIKGDALSASFIQGLRRQQSGARFIQYQWDSVKRVPNALQLAPLFDRVFSFDRYDCQTYANFTFRPLFFRGEAGQAQLPGASRFDLVFIGWLHADRLQRIIEVERKLAKLGVRSYFFLYTGIRTYLKECFKGNAKNLYVSKADYADVEKITLSATTVLDIPHPDQTGLTIRTIETLGKHRKLITTNRDVVHYDFFNPANILVLDELDADLMRAFIDVPYQQTDAAIVARYSLQSWVAEIFS